MQIKVCNEEGDAKVRIVNPAGEEEQVVSESTVAAGQEVTLTLPEVHDESGIQLGDVEDSPQPA
ncbi:MAG TPA: hypothetical protein VF245_12805 [Solirubrobacterales bacterium]